MKKGKGIFLGFLIIILTFFIMFFKTIVHFFTDYQWFKEVGYDRVFLTKWITEIKIGIPLFIILAIFIHFYLLSIKKDYYKKINISYDPISEKRLNRMVLLGSSIVSLMISITISKNYWFDFLRFFNTTGFNIQDPIFKKDVAFYIFQLPLINKIYFLMIGFIIFLAVVTLLFYFILVSLRRPTLFETYEGIGNLRLNIGFNRENIKKLFDIGLRQIKILGIIFFIILGVGYLLKSYDLLYSPRGVAYGASFTDMHVTLWVYRLMICLSFLSIIFLIIGIKSKKLSLSITGPILMILVSIIGNFIALGVQSYIVDPDEISKERKYLNDNIKYTKMAYGLNHIQEKNFSSEENLKKEDIEKNRDTISNIRINDYQPTKQFYNQRQGIRLYYEFHDVDVDRYDVNGKYTQVFLSAREINSSKINKQWINQHLKYTHGYGLALSPVNRITVEGQPELMIKNIPPQSDIKNIKINQPEIYFGELTDNYIITNTKEEEFDYPKGDINAETFYKGDAGIRLKGINRLLYAIEEGSLKMLVSGNITSDSKILMYRNIKERVKKIAPFIEYDGDPYLVADNGKLFWIIDGYTISKNYPYAEPYVGEGQNYIRNSVKVVIDAYSGKTTYYMADQRDPLIKTLDKIFPGLLTPMDQMPEGIKKHIRYPQVLFDIQSNVYKIYHMTNTDVFYLKEDLWDIANQIYGKEQQVMESSYFIMKLPNEKKEEFILSIPYTPKNKPNMTALLVARNDGENYGQLIVYKLPKQKNIYGPMQIESKIAQDTNISKEFTLWGQQGSTYIRGNLLTIPIENSLIYVEPIYLKADNENSLPEVKRVVVAYGDKIAYEETLDKAITKLFGTADQIEEVKKPNITEEPQNSKNMIIKINDLFQKSQEAQRNGKWADYGKYIEELGQSIEKLKNMKE